MNLMLIEPDQIDERGCVAVTGRQFQHLRDTLKRQEGDAIKTGIIGGKSGLARVASMGANTALIDVAELNQPAIRASAITLLIALPRPQMLKRILQTAATFAVEKITFIHTQKVQKSYWQSPRLHAQAIREELVLGAEQGAHTHLPLVQLMPGNDKLNHSVFPSLNPHSEKLIAHQHRDATRCESAAEDKDYVVAIGPEGGFEEEEVALFQHHGFQTVHLGRHILRVETAVTAVLARMLL